MEIERINSAEELIKRIHDENVRIHEETKQIIDSEPKMEDKRLIRN